MVMNDGNTSGPGHHPTPLEAGLERAMSPFQEFIHDQTSASVILLLCTLLALVIANSPLAQDYQQLIHMQLGLVLGERSFSMSIGHWVNEALMALFFFILGLEIKREILVGELQDPQQSLPVIAAASGGMLLPASIFLLLNQGSATVHGWGIPMATDAAFAIGVLALLGRRIPPALLTFLTALAIIDDLGSILVIAVFYTATIDLASLIMQPGRLPPSPGVYHRWRPGVAGHAGFRCARHGGRCAGRHDRTGTTQAGSGMVRTARTAADQ